MRLIRPSAHFEASHSSLIEEFRKRGDDLVPWVLAEVGGDFAEYVTRLEQYSRGFGLPKGFVPTTTLWLVDGSDEIVAVSSLRHELTPSLLDYGGHIGFGVRPGARRQGYATEILRGTLMEARTLGIDKVLLTCDKNNVGSAKAISKNGGQLWDERYMKDHACVLQRYWIHLR